MGEEEGGGVFVFVVRTFPLTPPPPFSTTFLPLLYFPAALSPPFSSCLPLPSSPSCPLYSPRPPSPSSLFSPALPPLSPPSNPPPPRAMERRTRLNARCLLSSVNLAQTDEGRGAVGRRRCMRSERRRLVSGQGCWSKERHGKEIGSWVRGRDSREGERGKIRNKKGEKILKRGERKGNTECVEDSSV